MNVRLIQGLLFRNGIILLKKMSDTQNESNLHTFMYK